MRLTTARTRTRLQVAIGITDSTVNAAPFIAGIETGWGQVLDTLAEAVSAFQSTPQTPTPMPQKERER